MATRPNQQGGASAPSNVVRLPTAPSRKVRQTWNRQTRAMREQLPQFPRERHMFPGMRKALDKARLIREIDVTPELIIATALYQTLDEMDQLKVRALAGVAGITQRSAILAGEWLDYSGKGMCNGDRLDLCRCLDKLNSGEWE